MALKTYDPKQLVFTYGGVAITGYADGTFVNITPNAESWTKVVGADGKDVSRARSNDDTYEVTITLASTSASNEYLSTVKLTDDLTGKGALPLLVQDLSGNTLFFVESAWIRQAPDVEFSKEVTERAWVFDTVNVSEYIVGGNN